MRVGGKKIQNDNTSAFGSVELNPFRTRVVTVAHSNEIDSKGDHGLLYIIGTAMQGASKAPATLWHR